MGRLVTVAVVVAVAAAMAAAQSDARSLERAQRILQRSMAKRDAGDLSGALAGFRQMMREYPDVIEAYMNAGAAYEAMGDRAAARATILKGARRLPHISVYRRRYSLGHLHSLLCRTLINDCLARREANPQNDVREDTIVKRSALAAWGLKRPDVDKTMAKLDADCCQDSATMKKVCTAAARLDERDHRVFGDLGRMRYLLGDIEGAATAYEDAIRVLQEFDDGSESDADLGRYKKILNQLYNVIYKRNVFSPFDAPTAVQALRNAVMHVPSIENKQNLGALLRCHRPIGEGDARNLYIDAMHQRCDEISQMGTRRRLVFEWEDIGADVNITAQGGQTYRLEVPGRTVVKDDDGDYVPLSFGDILPVEFAEREFFVARVPKATMEGATGVIYTDSKVFYAGHSWMPLDYTGGTTSDVVLDVPHATATIDPSNKDNWYHWIVEGLGAIALTRRFVADLPIMLPDSQWARDAVALFGIPEDKVMWYNHEGPRQYRFEELVRVDWREAKGAPISDGPSMQNMHHPGRLGVLMAREAVRKAVDASPGDGPKPEIIYVARGNHEFARSVEHEDDLVELIADLVGDDKFHVFRAAPSTTLMDQARLFSRAQVIIGPHGAGLSNMMFAPTGVTIVYFPIRPAVDNCFANLAAAIGAKLHPVDSFNAYYNGPYIADDVHIDLVLGALNKLLKSRTPAPKNHDEL